jgi:hypothetical protein
MLSIILVVVALLVIAAVIGVARQPATFHIGRSVHIDAPAARIFPHVNASRGWEAWSPWQKRDPGAVFNYEGPAAGVGAVTRFAGRKAGTGTATIVESRPAQLVRFRLDMQKPFKAVSDATFTFAPDDSGTVVTWSISGPLTTPAKFMRLFIDCDEMCGKAFVEGLNDLKRYVENGARDTAAVPISA